MMVVFWCSTLCSQISMYRIIKGPLWHQLYGWIYIYVCDQCTYLHEICEFNSSLWQRIPDTTLCDKVCQWHSGVFSLNFSTNKGNCHNIAEIFPSAWFFLLVKFLPVRNIGSFCGCLHQKYVTVFNSQTFCMFVMYFEDITLHIIISKW
jgi:hypothetical protein